MKTIAVTGGIASGKSAAAKLLQEEFEEESVATFDCDAEVHNLLTNSSIIAKLTEEFGSIILNPNGSVNRSELRDLVFADNDCRLKLEGILHPEILSSANQALSDATSQENVPYVFIIEVPLLYEVDFPIKRDLDLVIATSRETQIKRLSEIRKLDPETIESLLASQLPISEKIEKGDVVIWNDGLPEELRNQINLLSESLRSNTLSIL